MRGFARGLLPVAGAALVSLGTAFPSIAAQSRTVALEPRSGTWFTVELAPGEQYRGEALLTNLLDQSLGGYLYSADAFPTPQGGFGLRERPDVGDAVALWAGVPVRRVTLAPREQRIVRFTLAVPADADPGDYSGGIVFERDRAGGSSETGPQLGIIERVGARIYLTVAGERMPSLAVTRLSRSGPVFRVTLENRGNVRLKPETTVTVTSMRGRTVRLETSGPAEPIHPKQRVTLTARWEHPGFLGRFHATVSAAYEGPSTAAGETRFWLIPWKLLVIALACLVVLAGAVARAVRWVRRARRALRATREPLAGAHAEPVSPAREVEPAASPEAGRVPTATRAKRSARARKTKGKATRPARAASAGRPPHKSARSRTPAGSRGRAAAPELDPARPGGLSGGIPAGGPPHPAPRSSSEPRSRSRRRA